ncbi:MAG: hypothetical protein IJW97_09110 [Clostridia bacterium]|nr:hypothetical protein [Clostridia bacterium]
MSKKENSTNYGKILAITGAVVAGACAVIWFALKLYRKYCLLDNYAYDDDFSDLPEDDFGSVVDGECEVVLEEEEAEEETLPGIDSDVDPIDLGEAEAVAE